MLRSRPTYEKVFHDPRPLPSQLRPRPDEEDDADTERHGKRRCAGIGYESHDEDVGRRKLFEPIERRLAPAIAAINTCTLSWRREVRMHPWFQLPKKMPAWSIAIRGITIPRTRSSDTIRCRVLDEAWSSVEPRVSVASWISSDGGMALYEASVRPLPSSRGCRSADSAIVAKTCDDRRAASSEGRQI